MCILHVHPIDIKDTTQKKTADFFDGLKRKIPQNIYKASSMTYLQILHDKVGLIPEMQECLAYANWEIQIGK